MTADSKSLKERELQRRKDMAECIAWINSLGPGCESLQIHECLNEIYIKVGCIGAQIQTLRTKIVKKAREEEDSRRKKGGHRGVTELTLEQRTEVKDEFLRTIEWLEPMIKQMKILIDRFLEKEET